MAIIALTLADGLQPSEPSRIVLRSEQIAGMTVNTATKNIVLQFLSGAEVTVPCADVAAVAKKIEDAL